MSLYKPKKSPFYHYDFWSERVRFHGSTGKTNKREAREVEATRKAQARIEVRARRDGEAQIKGELPLTLDVAAGRWWLEVGQHRADSGDCWTALERMLDRFGPGKLVKDITDADVAGWVAERRGERVWGKAKLKDGRLAPLVSPTTVNRTTVDPLRRIFGRARKAWKLPFANEPNWGALRLPEPEECVRELTAPEQAALTAAADPDYERVYRFARLAGLRKKTCLIPKAAVKWDLGRIEIAGKGKKINRVPISEPIRAVLEECWDDHPTMVFTYEAKVTRDKRVKGKRYPITIPGLSSQWKRDRARAAITAPSIANYRFHDNRHTAATRVLRTSKNLKIAQKLLNHARITTTAKYAHVLDEEVLAAMNAVPEAGKKSRTGSRNRSPARAKRQVRRA